MQMLLKGKGISLDVVSLTVLDSSALQPRKWQLTGTGCSTAVQASSCPEPTLTGYWTHSIQPAGILHPNQPR